MTPDELKAIRERDALCIRSLKPHQRMEVEEDRHALLRHVEELEARLAACEMKIAEADRLLRPVQDCDPDIREWLGMPRYDYSASGKT